MSLPIQYIPYKSYIDGSFWCMLNERKLKEFQLDEVPIDLIGYVRLNAQQNHEMKMFLNLDHSSFESLERKSMSKGIVQIYGKLKNFNNHTEFNNCPKREIFEHFAQKILQSIADRSILQNPTMLNTFFIVSFADLKRYKYHYWIGYPAFINKKSPLSYYTKHSSQGHGLKFQKSDDPNFNYFYFILQKKNDQYSGQPLHSILTLMEEDSDLSDVYFSYLDPLFTSNAFTWFLRNFLLCLQYYFPGKDLNILRYKGMSISDVKDIEMNEYDIIQVQGIPKTLNIDEDYAITGWEKDATGKILEHFVDLSPSMDPIHLAESALALNLELMKWRLVPTLNLERMESCKILLIGAGTLGCNVARCLLAWGALNITFVDNGNISLSNPIRQSLYQWTNSQGEQKHKALLAVEGLKRIYPNVKAEGFVLNVPMPGHYGVLSNEEVKNDIHQLTELIKRMDVIFLLTDSRESRWLPTLLATFYNKLAITIALGFDTFLVIRNGTDPHHHGTLGCYFCHDVVAPSDSLSSRALDQQCTISRPGLSMIASGLGVELMASVLQGYTKLNALRMLLCMNSLDNGALGSAPHQIRGNLSQFKQDTVNTLAFDKCTACSTHVLSKYKEEEENFIMDVIQTPDLLCKVSGLDKLTRELENIELSSLSSSTHSIDDF